MPTGQAGLTGTVQICLLLFFFILLYGVYAFLSIVGGVFVVVNGADEVYTVGIERLAGHVLGIYLADEVGSRLSLRFQSVFRPRGVWTRAGK